MKILFTQFVAMYWKKFISLTVVGSLLFSLVVPPYLAATSLQEASQRDSPFLQKNPLRGGTTKSHSRALVKDSVKGIEQDEREFGSYKLRRQLLSSRLSEAENKVIQMAESAQQSPQGARIPPEKFPTAIAEYKRGLERKGILRVESRPHGLRGSRFRISSLKRAIGSITSLHAGRIGRAIERRIGGSIERLASLGGRRIWDYIESMTALHAGTILMHLRTIKENYSLLHIPPTPDYNIPQPQTFAYLFRAALDGDKDIGRWSHLYSAGERSVRVTRKDDKWEYITEMGAIHSYRFRSALSRVMKAYVEQWEVLAEDYYDSRKINGEWVNTLVTKAKRTIGDYLVKSMRQEERDLIGEFLTIFDDLKEDKYSYCKIDEVDVSLYDGPGFIWGEDIFQLAYFTLQSRELDDFGKRSILYEDRKHENYWTKGYFWIDRRYANILIEYGKKHGKEALRILMRTHAERELKGQSNIKLGGQHTTYDTVHDKLLDKPGQRDLMEFAKRAANDIRLGDFEDYILVRDLIDTWDIRISAIPENKIGVFGEYLISLYLTIKAGRDYAPREEKTLKDIFLLIRRDKELYLEYRSQIEELLARNRDATREELEEIKIAFMELLKEREKEREIQGFAIRHPRFIRLFGREMVVNNIDALLEFEKRVENVRWDGKGLVFGIFNKLFRVVGAIVTSENLMEVAEDIFRIIVRYKTDYRVDNVRDFILIVWKELDFMMKYFGPKRAAKKFHQIAGFCSKIPLFGWYLFKKRIELEKHLRWLHPDTYRRMEEEKKYNSSVHWMKRMRDEHLETWYGWILFFGTLIYAPYAYSYDLHTTITIWNEIVHSVSSLLPYLTVGIVSVAFGAALDKGNQGLDNRTNLNSGKNDVQQAIVDIAKKAGDEEEVVQEILSPTLYQALKGIVEENPVRLF
ncbi:MAG: hypothetical protein HYT97_09855, partial [Elusimicrobia bacterium]|nr:hypothetical protein [Elusimicrobiota bacterium]